MPDKNWEEMWAAGLNPGDAFDARRAEPALADLVDSGALPNGVALVPGCGRGYAVAALASSDRAVVGLEISETAKAACEAYLATCGDVVGERAKVVVDDFFAHAPREKYDLVYDCTFLCAIPPGRREEWGKRMGALVKPGGELVSLVFPIGDFEGGPPFALRPSIVEALLSANGFEAMSLTEVPEAQWARGEAGVPLPVEKEVTDGDIVRTYT